MNHNQLTSFVKLADFKSFNKAADQLYISHQALKKQIDSLEDEIGFPLFIRSYKGASLTPAGQHFYEGVLKYFDSFNTLIAECKTIAEHDNLIKIGNPNQPHLILEQAFAVFSQKYPDVTMDIQFLNEKGTISSVLSGDVDISEHIFASLDEADKSDIEYYKLCDMPYKCVMSSGHPFAKMKVLKLEDFASYTVSLRKHGNMKIIEQLKEHCKGDIRINEVEHDYTHNIMSVCYNHGLYITRKRQLNQDFSLVTVPIESDVPCECCLIWRKNPSPIVKKFIKVAKELFPDG